MRWTEEAERILAALVGMVPETYRPLAEASARAEAEGQAAERSAAEVGVEDAVRAWIAITPADQRDGLVAVLDQLGVDVEAYADELSAVDEEQPTEED